MISTIELIQVVTLCLGETASGAFFKPAQSSDKVHALNKHTTEFKPNCSDRQIEFAQFERFSPTILFTFPPAFPRPTRQSPARVARYADIQPVHPNHRRSLGSSFKLDYRIRILDACSRSVLPSC